MFLYYSGSCGITKFPDESGAYLRGEPEDVLEESTIMLSYALIQGNKQNQGDRMKRLLALRQQPLERATRLMIAKELPPKQDHQVGVVASHFLDSGAFSQWTLAAQYAKEHRCGRWDYYDTPEFYTYLDAYAQFIKEYKVAIDLYANVDVIPNPELTWRNQCYLEKKHGLRPVPVVHYTEDLKWLAHYMERDYELIALGGLVGSTDTDVCVAWVDRCFELVCDTPDKLPKVKIHGFGVTTHSLLLRCPWWSVDSTSWTKVGAFGGILVPHKRRGRFAYDQEPYLMKVSRDSPDVKKNKTHVLNLSPPEQAIIQEWLDFIGIPMGKQDASGKVLEWGVVTHHLYRRAANLHYYEHMRKSLPPWPWPFTSKRRKGFGIV